MDGLERTGSPEVDAWFLSRLLFVWPASLFRLAKRRALQAEDLWTLPPADQAQAITERFSAAWSNSAAKLRERKQIDPNVPLGKADREAVFTSAVTTFLGTTFWVAAPLVKLLNSSVQFAFPVLLFGCIAFIEGSKPFGVLPLTPEVGFALAIALGVMQAVKATTENAYFFLTMRSGWQIRTAVTTGVFGKSLRLSASARQQRTLGEMVNLMQVDATKLEMFTGQFHVLWDGLYQICGYCAMLALLIGWPTALGVIVMILSIPVQLKIMQATGRGEARAARHADGRVKSVNEALQSMASVKMYSWEDRFCALIERHRAKEIGERRHLAKLLSFARSYMMAVPLLVNVAAFVGYALSDGEIKASTLFAALAAFGQLRFPLMFYPMALASLAQARVSRTRLAGLLALAETDAHNTTAKANVRQRATALPSFTLRPRKTTKERMEAMEAGEAAVGDGGVTAGCLGDAPIESTEAAGSIAVGIRGGEFWWAEPAPAGANAEAAAALSAAATPGKGERGGKGDATSTPGTQTAAAPPAAAAAARLQLAAQRPTLHAISLEVRPGELVAVVGQTGAGKSSLCAALLGEMVQVAGSPLVAPSSVAYCAQSAWILNASVRENIIFGEEFDATRYAAVLRCCQLTADLAALPHGDETEIGERGITLSGGQKQRVAIARAAYSARPVCILDDVLSALDPEVASAVFEECIVGHMAASTVVLVTNRLDLAPRCDRVVLIEADARGVGSITQSGSHDALLARGGAYAALLVQSSVSQLSASEQEGKRAAKQAKAAATAAAAAAAAKATAAKAVTATAAAPAATGSTAGKLMQDEERALGAVTGGVYGNYIRRGGGWGLTVPLLLLHVVTTGLATLSSLWVGFWTADAAPINPDDSPYSTLPFAAYVGGYAAIGLLVAAATFLRTVLMSFFCLGASRKLHDQLVRQVMRAPLSFFDTTPLGRIVSRFSKDMFSIDSELMGFADFFLFMIATLAFTLAIVAVATPWFLVAAVPILVVYRHFVQIYRKVSRETKRLESVARSPVFAHYSETLCGTATIRAYAVDRRFTAANMQLVDQLNEAYYINKVADRWLAVRLEILGAVIITCAAVLAVLRVVLARDAGDEVDSFYVALAGTSLSGAIGVTGILNFVMRSFGQLEAAMTCTERVLHYIQHVPQEPAATSSSPPPPTWPQHGEIELRGLHMRYRPNTPLVLKGLTASIKGGHRVGIVGRTGSGKSSLLLALLRLVEPLSAEECGGEAGLECEGKEAGRDCWDDGKGGAKGGGGEAPISIDGIDTRSIGLTELRREIAIIPQSPALFSGSVRSNMDPFDEYTDDEIWSALERCEMRAAVEQLLEGSRSDGVNALLATVAEYGENLSQGQRQLICMARALLRHARILILDEATSAVDYVTDAKIQTMIRTAFAGCTILVIAHRINTISDSDHILVLGDGTLLESGPPAVLLQDPQSHYSRIVAETDLDEETEE